MNGEPSVRTTTTVRVERLVDCTFESAIDGVELILSLFSEPIFGGARVPFSALGLPLRGALSRRVAVRFTRENDPTEPGRAHDRYRFHWSAQSRWLPEFDGTLSFRIATGQTLVMLEGSYVPPMDLAGLVFDRLAGRQIAIATLEDILERLANTLEVRHKRETDGLVTPAPALG